jgi:hypothetical protein
MLHCRPLGAQYHLGLPEAENPHDTALFQTIAFTDEVKTQVATFSGKATWPTWQALLGCIVLCIAYLANFCHALSYFTIFYIAHVWAFSVRLASDRVPASILFAQISRTLRISQTWLWLPQSVHRKSKVVLGCGSFLHRPKDLLFLMVLDASASGVLAAWGQLPSVLAHCSQDGHYKRAAYVSSFKPSLAFACLRLSWRARKKSVGLWVSLRTMQNDARNGCACCVCCVCFRKLGFSDVFWSVCICNGLIWLRIQFEYTSGTKNMQAIG